MVFIGSFFVGVFVTRIWLKQLPQPIVLQKAAPVASIQQGVEAPSVRFAPLINGEFQKEHVPDALFTLAKYLSRELLPAENDPIRKSYTEEEMKKRMEIMEIFGAKLGTVEGAKYDGYILNIVRWLHILESEFYETEIIAHEIFYLLDTENNVILIKNEGELAYMDEDFFDEVLKSEEFGEFAKLFRIDDEFKIPEIEIPKVLKDEQQNVFEFYNTSGLYTKMQSGTDSSKVIKTTDPKTGKVYHLFVDGKQHVFIPPDTNIARYEYKIPWKMDENAKIYWNDGTAGDVLESFQSVVERDCGFENLDVVTNIPMMKASGYIINSNNERYELFEPVWTKQDYEDKDSDAYKYYVSASLDYGEEELPYSFDTYLNLPPLFFWKDPFGRWLRFRHWRAIDSWCSQGERKIKKIST
ncbi:MAG: hypothetical protein AAB664_04155 [Patescibacteria group bacterium]